MMRKGLLIISILVICMGTARTGAGAGQPEQDLGVTVHFASGKADLGHDDKAELRRFFQTYATGPQSRLFVVGYTDASGDRTRNLQLSGQRAEAVRREIISAFGIDAHIVVALGKGGQNPVGDNKSRTGRALNRRVEIYLANGQPRAPQRTYGPGDPFWPDINSLIQEADALIRQRRLDGAMQKLHKARALGGDHYADWHTAWGIAGYYGQAPWEEARAHLVTALELDPYNQTARDFLSRMEARLKVMRAEITHDMGRSVDAAIEITTMAQQYEYLRLFEVEPLVHEALAHHPIDVWYCRDQDGAQVVYYFNHGRVYHWAFAQIPAARPGLKGDQAPGTESAGFAGPPGKTTATAPGLAAALSPEGKHRAIWESRIFK